MLEPKEAQYIHQSWGRINVALHVWYIAIITTIVLPNLA